MTQVHWYWPEDSQKLVSASLTYVELDPELGSELGSGLQLGFRMLLLGLGRSNLQPDGPQGAGGLYARWYF